MQGLAKYFKGGNVEHKEIPKTIPVLTTILRPSPPHAPPHPPKIGSHPVPPHGKNGSYPKPHHPSPPAVVLAAFIPNSFKVLSPLSASVGKLEDAYIVSKLKVVRHFYLPSSG